MSQRPVHAARRLLAVVTGAALVVGLGVVPFASPAAANPPSDQGPFGSDGELDAVDLATYPSYLVTAGGLANYLSQSEAGTVVQEFGATGAADAEVQRSWAHAEPYPFTNGAAASAVDAAVGDFDGDGSVDVAYLVDGGAIRRINILGSQNEGFVYSASIDVPQSTTEVEVLEAEPETGMPASILAITNESNTKPLRLYSIVNGAIAERTVDFSGPFGQSESFGRFLSVAHRPDWDRYANEYPAERDSTIVVAETGDGSQLFTRMLRFEVQGGSIQAVTERTAFLGETGVTWTAGAVDDASIAYDWGNDVNAMARIVVGVKRGTATSPVRPAKTLVWNVSLDPPVGPFGPPPFPQIDQLFDWCQASFSTPVVDMDINEHARVLSCAGVAEGTPDTIVTSRTGGILPAGAFQVTHDQFPVAGAPQLDELASARLEVPCMWLLEGMEETENSQGCSSGFRQTRSNPFLNFGQMGVVSLALTVRGGSPLADKPLYITRTQRGSGSPLTTVVDAVATGSPTSGQLLSTRLPHQRNTVQLAVTPNSRTVVDTDPMPLAFLAAPPQVAGSGQEADPPVFADTAATGTTTGTSTSSRTGAYIGVDWEDPLGTLGVEVTASMEFEAEQGHEASREIETSEAFSGLTDDDTVVYSTNRLERYTGTVLTSSTGVGLGDDVSFDLPLGSVTSAASVTNMRSRFPEFRPGGSLAGALDSFFPHEVGDPGTYSAYDGSGAAVDQYCDGTIAGDVRDIEAFDPLVPPNPFYAPKPADPPPPDVLVSDVHQVLVGTGNSEGASFAINSSSTNTRLESKSVDIDAGFVTGYVKAGLTAGFTWSTSWSQTLAKGVEFESSVGHIPGTGEFLEDETYDWRSFLCQKTVQTGKGPLTAWVLNYTVDDYYGSGGLEPLSPLVSEYPKESQPVDELRPDLSWAQDTGTVQRYDWRIEAVGAQDVHTGTVSYSTPFESNRTRPTSQQVAPQRNLLPNQLYRWKVTATDFFGNATQSDYEFFVTEGPPQAEFITSTLTPAVGEAVDFLNQTDTSEPVDFFWDFGDGTTSDDASPEHAFDVAGTYDVTLTADHAQGSTSYTRRLVVAAAARDDVYLATEDQMLITDAPGVLSNDPGAAQAELVTPPGRGDLDLDGDGSFTYEPFSDECGGDSFAYRLTGTQKVATATINVRCLQDAPSTMADSFAGVEDTPLSVPGPEGLLGNDHDADGDDLTARLVTPPTRGSVTVGLDGSLSYVPRPDLCGTDTFTYAAYDGSASRNATASVAVACVNDKPRMGYDAVRTNEDTRPLINVLANDVDPDRDALALSVVRAPTLGSAVVTTGRFTYTPRPNVCGTDSFVYRAKDPSGAYGDALVRVTVACVNDAPAAGRDSYNRASGRSLTVAAPGVLRNDVDVDGPRKLAYLYKAPAAGRVTLRTDGSFTYTPSPGAAVDTFWYRVWDGAAWSAPVAVTIRRA